MTIRNVNISDLNSFFSRSAIGAERYLEEFLNNKLPQSYPPHDIDVLSEDDYLITIAVAGFKKHELTVSSNNGSLVIEGKKDQEASENTDSGYPKKVFNGIARRDFMKQFKLTEYVVVTEVELEDGILSIKLTRELPDILKHRTIEIK